MAPAHRAVRRDPQARNPKHEIRNKFKTAGKTASIQTAEPRGLVLLRSVLPFGICFGFRVSCFGFPPRAPSPGHGLRHPCASLLQPVASGLSFSVAQALDRGGDPSAEGDEAGQEPDRRLRRRAGPDSAARTARLTALCAGSPGVHNPSGRPSAWPVRFDGCATRSRVSPRRSRPCSLPTSPTSTNPCSH